MTARVTPLPRKPYSRRKPPGLYNAGYLDQEHQNIQQSITSLIRADSGVANVLDYGLNLKAGSDITRPVLDALDDKGAAWLPPGNWVTSANITLPTWGSLLAIPGLTIITPTSALSNKEVFTLGASSTLKGLSLRGLNTTGAIALGGGNAGLISNVTVSDLDLRSFVGSGARAIKIGQTVTGNFHNIYAASNEYGLECDGSNSPTNIDFDNCQWVLSVRKGVWFKTGIGVNFNVNDFEANGEEGFYIQNVGGTATEIRLSQCWLEGNWTSLSGAARHAQYSFNCAGAVGPSGTIRVAVQDTLFNADSATTARAMHLTNAIAFLVDNVNVRNEAGQILVDGTSRGQFDHWADQNGLYTSTVTDSTTPGSVLKPRDNTEDNLLSAWTSYTPTYSAAGSMTFGTVITTLARYKVVGKTVTVCYNFMGTTGGVANIAISATLPPNFQSQTSAAYNPGIVSQDGGSTYALCLARPDAVNPTSSVSFYLSGFGNYGLGAGRQVIATFTFELA